MTNKIPIKEGSFIESPEGSFLIANKCTSCKQIFFPKSLSCLDCFSDDMEELRLSRRGKLYSYTIGYMPASHFQPPYAIGYIDMPEGVRIFSPLNITEDKPFKIGMEMEVTIETLWLDGDNEIIGYKFKPV